MGEAFCLIPCKSFCINHFGTCSQVLEVNTTFQDTEMFFHETEEEIVNLQPFQPKLIVPKYIKQYYPWILANLRWVHKIIILSLYFCNVFHPSWSEYKKASELQTRNAKVQWAEAQLPSQRSTTQLLTCSFLPQWYE